MFWDGALGSGRFQVALGVGRAGVDCTVGHSTSPRATLCLRFYLQKDSEAKCSLKNTGKWHSGAFQIC